MQKNENYYYFHKIIIYDFSAEDSAILIDKNTTETVSIDLCCFNKYSSKNGPAAILLDVYKIILQRSSFVDMISYQKTIDSGCSAKLHSYDLSFNYSAATKCETTHHDNFNLRKGKQQLSYLNNTHNQINHITFTYLVACTNCEVSFCNICNNPSTEGTELQASTCDCSLHHCAFSYNKCSNGSSFKSHGVVRMYDQGTMTARFLYFLGNDQPPLSLDEIKGATLFAEDIFTDSKDFFSVAPVKVGTVDTLPVFYGERAAVNCRRGTERVRGVAVDRFRIAVCLLFVNFC